VSLLKTPEEAEAAQQVQAERARLRALVKHQLTEQAAVAEADEGASLAERLVVGRQPGSGGKAAAGRPGAGGEARAVAAAGAGGARAPAGGSAAAAASSDEDGDGGGDDDEEDGFFLSGPDGEADERPQEASRLARQPPAGHVPAQPAAAAARAAGASAAGASAGPAKRKQPPAEAAGEGGQAKKRSKQAAEQAAAPSAWTMPEGELRCFCGGVARGGGGGSQQGGRHGCLAGTVLGCLECRCLLVQHGRHKPPMHDGACAHHPPRRRRFFHGG